MENLNHYIKKEGDCDEITANGKLCPNRARFKGKCMIHAKMYEFKIKAKHKI